MLLRSAFVSAALLAVPPVVAHPGAAVVLLAASLVDAVVSRTGGWGASAAHSEL